MGHDRGSQRIFALRFSILAAIGVPLACGGATGADSPNTTADAGEGSASLAGRGSAGGAPGHFPDCTSPKTNPITGLVSCAEGYEHRPQAVTCETMPVGAGGVGGAAGPLPRAPASPEAVDCGEDAAVCDAFELGYCDAIGGGAAPSVCYSGCRADEDCGAGRICICQDGSPTGGVCHRSDCTTDDDCGSGYRCASADAGCGLGVFICQRAEDTCSGAMDCEEGDQCGAGDPSAPVPRRCTAPDGCGRPFLVEAQARVADAVTRCDWRGSARLTPELSHLNALERQQLAAHWTRLGQLEHASIAAFARFNLQLLALGAPPELIQASTQALADETAHARLCFELASAYAGHDVGPDRLDVTGSLVPTSLGEIVDLVIAEGCFGETGAALDALDAADAATDPVIRDAYARIAHDEQRHAELAFRFVRWALDRAPTTVRERLQAARRNPPLAHPAAAQVALPCFEALLQAAPATPAQELVT